VFAISGKAYAAKKILLLQKELKKLMNELGRSSYALTESDRQDPAKKQSYINAASKLYQKLIAPVEDVLNNKELVIIPDGLLWELPFEALVTAKTEAEAKKLEALAYEKLPLLNQFHSIRYSPSATAFFRSFSAPPSKEQGLFALAPVFDAQKETPIFASRSIANRDTPKPLRACPAAKAK
jgi:CHAT domain-containing protein